MLILFKTVIWLYKHNIIKKKQDKAYKNETLSNFFYIKNINNKVIRYN